jgi:acyl-CoA reductase-like NAD-dependent aldehyde dehydrogenase
MAQTKSGPDRLIIPMVSLQHLLEAVSDGVATLTLNRPERLNALSTPMMEGLAHTMAGRIRAGTVWINTYRAVSFMMPFGGYKASGLGRENGIEAIEAICNPRASGSTTDRGAEIHSL